MLVYGFHAIDTLLKKNKTILSIHILQKSTIKTKRKEDIIKLAKRKGVKCYKYQVTKDYEKEWKKQTKEKVTRSQGIFAIIEPPKKNSAESILDSALEKKDPMVLFLDSIMDEQNLGAILRIAAFFAVDGVIWATRRSAPISPRVLKISSGAFVHVPVAFVPNLTRTLESAKKKGFWVYGLSEHSKHKLPQETFNRPSILLIGNEEKGIGPLLQKHCDAVLSLPSEGPQVSLNAAMACAVSLALVRNQQSLPKK